MNDFAKRMFATCHRAAWAPLLVFSLHVIFSRLLGAYLIFPTLYIPMHFFGGVAITYFFAFVFAVAAALGHLGSPNSLAVVLVSLLGTCSTTVFWEFSEFLSDRFLGTHAQLGLQDTLSDMLLGIFGALAYFSVNRFRPPVIVIAAVATGTRSEERVG